MIGRLIARLRAFFDDDDDDMERALMSKRTGQWA
jgi:hypothetical protein